MIVAVQNVYLLGVIADLPSHTVDVMNAAKGMLASAVAADAVVVDADAAAAVAGVYQFLFSIVALDAAVYCNKYQSISLKRSLDPRSSASKISVVILQQNVKNIMDLITLQRSILT